MCYQNQSGWPRICTQPARGDGGRYTALFLPYYQRGLHEPEFLCRQGARRPVRVLCPECANRSDARKHGIPAQDRASKIEPGSAYSRYCGRLFRAAKEHCLAYTCQPRAIVSSLLLEPWRTERAREDGAERVSVLHISPSANQPLHKVTAPALTRFGTDAFDVFRSLLVQPENFVARTVEEVFRPIVGTEHSDPATEGWSEYLCDRYSSLIARA
jgi:hypothetical protein